MDRQLVLASLLLGLVVPCGARSDPLAKEVELNGVRLSYIEQGSGEPVVFVHGAMSDLRVWEPVREPFAKRYRFIAYTQRYHGLGPWKDDGKDYSTATHADDLAKFITSLNAGAVHLVARSGGGAIGTTTALSNPSLIRSLTLYEPFITSVFPGDSPEGKAAREERAKANEPVIAAVRANDAIQASRLAYEYVSQLPRGGFDREPQAVQTMVIENARTLPLAFIDRPTTITCDRLKTFSRPTLLMRGERTQAFYALISEGVSRCMPAAQFVVLHNANHAGPSREPTAFSSTVLEFLSKY
jgi:pimeloyl-ACP methyl ester carboxylesterase